MTQTIASAPPEPAGLSSGEASRRLAQTGPNTLTARSSRGTLLGQLASFASPLVLILLVASVVSALIGDIINASIIFIIVALSAIINFVQTFRSQRAVEELRQQVAPTASVKRDGAWTDLARPDIVPGDVIRLAPGDLIPADARLIESRDLHVQEAALTGESAPVKKAPVEQPGPADTQGLVFLGTSVVSGSAIAEVIATGSRTAYGDIAAALTARPPETEFDRGSRRFGMLILRTVVFMVLFVFVISAALHRDPLQSLLFAVSLTVGITPEFLPMITTVTLGQGAVDLARRRVIVKNLASMQNFGSIDVLCSDKTGTLTSGEMQLDGHLDPAGQPSDLVLRLGYLNSAYETGVPNPMDHAMRNHAVTAALDLAVLRASHPDVADYRKIDEIPFDFERRRVSVVVEGPHGRELITKGAPESVLEACSAIVDGGQAVPLDAEQRARADTTFHALSGQGLRVIAVASRIAPAAPHYTAADEHDLTLAGFLTFVDAPLPDAAAVVQRLRDDGVTVKILTGDNALVARHVCERVGLDASTIITGDQLAAMSDPALAYTAEQCAIFARVTPAQKSRIIHLLKSRGHVVGFLGDGINDAPSLHAADVGISVARAVDVAKDAAEIILLDRGLATLHEGIMQGRRAFGNVMKYLLMCTSSSFGNMFSMAVSVLFLPFLPMLPTQILLLDFLYDLAQVTIPTDNVDASFIRKPRHWDISLIRDFMVFIGPVSSLYDFATFGVLLLVLHAGEVEFHTGWFVESLATQTLVLFVIRTIGNPLRSRPSLPLALTTSTIVVIGLLLPLSPLASLLGFTPLPAAFYGFLLLATVTYLLLVQVVKKRLMRRLEA